MRRLGTLIGQCAELAFWFAVGAAAMLALLASVNFAAHQIERTGFRLVDQGVENSSSRCFAYGFAPSLSRVHAEDEDAQQEAA